MNPDIILRSSGLGYRSLRNLKSNYQVGTCIESRKSGVTSKKWKLEKGDCSEKEYNFWIEFFKYLDVYKIIEDILYKDFEQITVDRSCTLNNGDNSGIYHELLIKNY